MWQTERTTLVIIYLIRNIVYRKITLPSSIQLQVSRVIVTNSIEVLKNLLRFRRNVLVCGNLESRKNFFISSYLGEKKLFRFAGKEVGHASHVILFCRVADIALMNPSEKSLVFSEEAFHFSLNTSLQNTISRENKSRFQ